MPSRRLIDKFPSDTTLWAVLRKFEAGVAGSAPAQKQKHNFTARAVALATASGESGRLFYETPVINILGRDISSFIDLQKTLGALGCTSGSVLLRLTFRVTETPMEEAIRDIETYFKSVEDDTPNESASQSNQTADAPESDITNTTSPNAEEEEIEAGQQPQPTEQSSRTDSSSPQTHSHPPISVQEETASPEENQQQHPSPESIPEPAPSITTPRPTAVYAPPTSSTPQAARQSYREEDYLPTVDQARAHQRNLKATSRPQRLPSDAELAAEKAAADSKLAAVRDIEVKIRFPDQSQVVSTFGQADSSASLYAYVRSCLREDLATQPFGLFYLPPPTATPAKASSNSKPSALSLIREEQTKLLIRDMKMTGRVLVQCLEQPGSKGMSRDVLRPELRAVAGEIKVEAPSDVVEEEAESSASLQATGEEKPSKSSAGGESKMRKWLKLPGKK